MNDSEARDETTASELFDWIMDYTAHRQFGAAGLERAECFGRISLAFQEIRAERDAELQRAMAVTVAAVAWANAETPAADATVGLLNALVDNGFLSRDGARK